MRYIRLIMVAAAATALLEGCAVGPAYVRPEVSSPATFIGGPAVEANTATATKVDLVNWWRSFNDPLLANLVERALTQNLGLQISPMTPRFAQQLGVSADTGGLVILDVDPNSDAGQKGIQPGDIVVSANYKGVDTVDQLNSIVGAAKSAGRATVLLRIQRRGQPLTYVPVRVR